MEEEKVLNALHMMKEAYEDAICEAAQDLHEGRESLNSPDMACYTRDLVSGFKSTLIDIGMMEGDGYSWDEGAERGSMRSRGSMRRSRVTGRYIRDSEPVDRQKLQEAINSIPDSKTRMEMQRMMDQMQNRM